ncbi:PREDICTED: calpain-5-like [Amphimedon queenslandica]|uniref:Calpain catalytic domain-containing protein n=1 Tax=Amphimedon queenslandica TaxID=400682 RepID=A0A1X7VUJ3_AMPQE|nr:PREDICTED: calpain-5-like [Amphimedon queenslandica]|eukprot:XP_011408714.2 PREDICTED: calpain-5-like [Amphimedon queenslandica]
MVRKFLNQNYSKLKRDHQRRGEQFTDPQFPPNAQSLFHSGKNDLEITWKRPGEICSNPKLIVDGLDPSDLNQGAVGNCWFVAACSALALERRLWNKVVVDVNEQEWDANHPERYAGIFHFRFWQFGEWVDVVIDDWLPTQGGKLIYNKSKSGNEFWSALLEKAYAKLAGSYEALSGGLTGDALVDFTGGVTETITLQSGDLADDEEKRKQLFDELIRAHEHHAMMSCSIEVKEGESPETKLDCGLVKGHAYTITDIRRMKLTSGLSSLFGNKEKLMMIKMRNPWGQKEWNGAWSDDSEEWKRVPKGEKDKMDLKVEDDGEFWMEFSDWLTWFSHCSICRIINTSSFSLQKTWHDATFHGEWKEKTAGGCFNHPDTFTNNPQYLFTLREEEEVMVSCMQKDPRMSKKAKTTGEPLPNFPIGFQIVKVEDNRTFRIHSMNFKEVGRVTYINRRSNFGRFTLGQGRYVIIPSTFEPNQERQFLLRFFSERNAHPVELKKDHPTRGFCGTLFCCCVKPYRGQVIVHLHSGQGLTKQDMSGAGADPYCKVTCGGNTVATSIKKDTLDPAFDTQLVFYVKNPEDATVKVQILNHGMMRDRFMGQVSTTLPAADGGSERRTMKLMEKGNEAETQGSVSFTISHHSDLRAI